MERLINATKCSWRGLLAALRSEAAFRQESVALLLAIPAALFLSSDPWRRVTLVGAVLFVMIVELLNTAVEKLCNRVTTDEDGQIATVKDLGSAAVGLSILLALGLWLVAVGDKLAR
ncbi:MAG: diacylglycerol kinase [Roseiarcus sp.]